ncbi:MAG: efflux RND transporter permease subunit, partial [Planctomycetes bacterium]|nr:efflux RND transporter permease subunit [Planctomycetota bacterium]
VQVITPLQRQVNVDLDRERLASYKLTPQDVARAVARENQEKSAGSIKMGDTDYMPRVPGEFKSVEPMNDIVIRASGGMIVRLRDLGHASYAFKDRDLHASINGRPGAIFFVKKQSEANTVQVARAVKAALKKLSDRLPPDVHIVNVMDGSEDIEQMVNDLKQTLVLGGLWAMLAVLIFLRQARGTLIIALTIPFSLIAAGTVMYLMDYSVNMMTMFALIVAIGMVVDNGIVILENITRHREEGESATEGAVFGASEVAMAVAASTLTTLCIFFPLLFVRGLTKVIFTPFAIVAAVVILASLFTALSMTPMLSSRLLPKDYAGAKSKSRSTFFRISEAAFDRLASGYSRLLGWSLRHRAVVIVSAIALFAGSVVLVPAIGWEFMPKEDRAMIMGTIKTPIGTRVERTAETMQAVHDAITQEIPSEEIRAVFTRCGVSGAGFTTDEGAYVGMFGVKLVRKDKRGRSTTEIAEGLRKRIQAMAGPQSISKFRISLEDPMSGMIMGGEQPLSVRILGDDLDVAYNYAQRLKAKIEQIPGTVDIAVSMEKGAPEVWANVDRQKASAMGLNVADVADAVRTAIYGRVASKYRIHGDEYDIRVRLREQDRMRIEDLGQLPVRLPTGDLVRLENVARVEKQRGPIKIERKDQRRIVRVEGDVHGRSLGEVMTDVENAIAHNPPPRGLTVTIGGQKEDIEEAFLWLGLALGVGRILVYMIMASQFESLIDPFVVMFSLPFAFIGVIWFLVMFGYSLNIVVFLGMLLLVGIVVNNAIVLVDYINILRARGRSMIEAVQEAGRTRLRAVLMTAITTIVALMPMAFKSGQGSEVWNPLGATIMGGLLVATLVTLVLVPTIYSIFESHVKSRNHA